MFYEYSSLKRQQNAVGLEGAIYKFIPRSVISSIAFALDPFQQFKSVSLKVAPANRTRRRTSQSIIDTGRVTNNKRTTSVQEYKFASNPDRWVDSYFVVNSWTVPNAAQPALTEVSIDTTKSTRPVGSDFGEFQKFRIVENLSPGRRTHTRNTNYTYYPGLTPYYFREVKIEESWIDGPSAWISSNTVDQLRTNEWARSTAEMQKNALSMFKGILPSNRTYTLARNLIELRDVPRGIMQLRDTLKHLAELSRSLQIPANLLEQIHSFKISLASVPKEYLSYCFGWAQVWRDAKSLLLSPEKFGKKIDFLIRRNGQATTYRSSRKIETTETSPLGYAYDTSPWELNPVTSSILSRKAELRMVVNAIFEFPGIDLPTFRDREWKRAMGVVPTPTDLYNLIPWTWLFDWFSGFGDYVQVMDNINSSPELINWGVITNEVDGELVTNFVSKSNDSQFIGIAGVGGTTTNTSRGNTHSSQLRYSSSVRKNVGSLFSVRATTDLSSLSSYQLSILGALITSRIKVT
jgi:hypothetical protein